MDFNEILELLNENESKDVFVEVTESIVVRQDAVHKLRLIPGSRFVLLNAGFSINTGHFVELISASPSKKNREIFEKNGIEISTNEPIKLFFSDYLPLKVFTPERPLYAEFKDSNYTNYVKFLEDRIELLKSLNDEAVEQAKQLKILEEFRDASFTLKNNVEDVITDVQLKAPELFEKTKESSSKAIEASKQKYSEISDKYEIDEKLETVKNKSKLFVSAFQAAATSFADKITEKMDDSDTIDPNNDNDRTRIEEWDNNGPR